jgi:hypothetical protein
LDITLEAIPANIVKLAYIEKTNFVTPVSLTSIGSFRFDYEFDYEYEI